jgi:hypothetical protein
LRRMAAKASDRRQHRTGHNSRARPIAAGKWHNKSGSAWSRLTCCNGRGPVTVAGDHHWRRGHEQDLSS